MTAVLNTEFENKAVNFMLNTSKQLISENFDKNDKCNKTIKVENDGSIIEIRRNCFTQPYFEDYRVTFVTTIENQKVYATFYLEWKSNDRNTELIPANTLWNPLTGKHSKREVKIRKCAKI